MRQREGSIPVGDGRIDRQGVISRAVRVAAERIVTLVLQEIFPFNLLLDTAGATFGGPRQIGMRGGVGQARKGSAGLLVERRQIDFLVWHSLGPGLNPAGTLGVL